MIEYYKTIFETAEKDYFCLWYSDIDDGFYAENKRVICFLEEAVLEAFCRAKGFPLMKECLIYKLDEIEDWLDGNKANVNCEQMLDFWNAASCFAFVTGQSFVGDDDNDGIDEIYDLLFYGIDQETDFSNEELEDLSAIISDGLDLVKSNLLPLK